MARCCRRSRKAATRKCTEGEVTLQEYAANLRQGRRGSIQPAGTMLFPMYVVRVPEFMRMVTAKPHQVLKREGIVEEYDPKLGPAVFVSHEWCSRHHPDPHFQQLAVLQGVLRRIACSDLHIYGDIASIMLFQTKPTVRMKELKPLVGGCIWYDYFCVPQPGVLGGTGGNVGEDMDKAVFSIPAYVEACRFFFVLAPPVHHVEFSGRVLDYQSWKERGWCRLERIARVLSPKQTHILLASKESALTQLRAQEYLMDAVGDGVFSVSEDRRRIAVVMVSLMENKLQALLLRNDLHGYRRMLSSRATLLRGLSVSPHDVCAPGFRVAKPPPGAAGAAVLAAFLRVYGFASVGDRDGGPTEPILFAARSGDFAAVEALLQCRADARARERANDSEYLALRNKTPLHAASLFNSDPCVVRLLLQSRASVEDRDGNGILPLHSAAYAGHEANVAALLDAKARISAKEPFGSTALHVACTMGRAKVCSQLLQAKASAAPNKDGTSPMVWAVLFGSGRPTIEALLAAPDSDVQRRISVKGVSRVSLLLAAVSIPHRVWGSQNVFSILACEVEGMSLLMLAALMGHVGEARALLAAGANPAARNARGRNAADFAELAGLQAHNVAFFRDMAGATELRRSKDSTQEQEILARLAALEAAMQGAAGGPGGGRARHSWLEPAPPAATGRPPAPADPVDITFIPEDQCN